MQTCKATGRVKKSERTALTADQTVRFMRRTGQFLHFRILQKRVKCQTITKLQLKNRSVVYIQLTFVYNYTQIQISYRTALSVPALLRNYSAEHTPHSSYVTCVPISTRNIAFVITTNNSIPRTAISRHCTFHHAIVDTLYLMMLYQYGVSLYKSVNLLITVFVDEVRILVAATEGSPETVDPALIQLISKALSTKGNRGRGRGRAWSCPVYFI